MSRVGGGEGRVNGASDDFMADAVVIPIRDDGMPPRIRDARTLGTLLPEAEMPVIGPEPDEGATEPGREVVAAPRLARHVVTLSDGHQVGVAVSGVGVPLVLVHGFTAEGFLYAQTLSRLVSMGFKVIAIDTANHGSTQGLPSGGGNFGEYSGLLARTLDELGVTQAFFAGHSMGGRVITQMCADEPERALGVILIDAIVGDAWDRLVNVGRIFPPAMAGVVIVLALDSLATPPLFKHPEQGAKLLRLIAPTYRGHARRPWRLFGPAISILRSRGSRWMLMRLAQEEVPVVAIHGTRDYAVPIQAAKDTARRSRGDLVVVEGATHSWLLRDPETLPAIMSELLEGRLGVAYRDAVRARGLDPDTAKLEEVDAAFYPSDALIRELTPPLEFVEFRRQRRGPAFGYKIEPAR